MQRIVTAITAMALALSVFGFTAQSAAAVTGYDSAYFGESAFLTLPAGSTGQFVAIFTNTGATGWTRGTGSQVNLAVCLADKTTCNVASPNAAWNPGTWLSSTAYATTSTNYVGPGQQGFFVYDVKAPAGGGYARFNGDLSLAATGSMIHPQGYFQDAFSPGAAGAAAVLTSVSPLTGSTAGGTTVTITGTGFVCTPAFPTVTFGGVAGTVTSCGSTTLVVTSPAGTAGNADVVVTNGGAAASNALPFTYADTTKPTFNSVTAQDSIATVTFSEAVCRSVAFAPSDWNVTVNGAPAALSTDNIPVCNATSSNAVTSANLFFTAPVPTGAFVAVTLMQTGGATGTTNANIVDTSGNPAVAPRTNTTTATAAETTKPTLLSASGATGSSTITLTFSEPVYCTGAFPASTASLTGVPATTTTITAITCPTTPATASTTFTATTSAPLAANTAYTVTLTTSTATGQVLDVVGNIMASPASATFSTGAADTAGPLSQDVSMTLNAGFTNTLDTGDVFRVAYNEAIAGTTLATTATIRLTDADGTTAQVTCGGNATCALATTAQTIGTVTYPIGQVLIVTMTGSPTTVGTAAGTVAGLQLPATVVDSAGITDIAGNPWNIPGSPDKTLN